MTERHTTWTRRDIEGAAINWRAVSQMEESEHFGPVTLARAEGYANALELVLRNLPPEGETAEHLMFGWFGVKHGRPPTQEETLLLTALAADFHLVRKTFVS